MRFFFLTWLLLAIAVAYGRSLAAAPAASKKATKSHWAATTTASAPWKSHSATSKQSAQFAAVEPQGDVSIVMPTDIKEATAYEVAEIVAEETGSDKEARDAAQAAIEV